MFMKQLLFLCLILFFNKIGFTQTNILYNDTLINQIDTNGIKNGLWIEFANPELIMVSRIVSRGYYKNNKKIGLWYYYHANSDISGLKKTIDYQANGNLVIDFGYKLIINKDSTKLSFYDLETLCVECKKIKSKYFKCVKYKRNGAIFRKRNYLSFEECLNKWDTKW